MTCVRMGRWQGSRSTGSRPISLAMAVDLSRPTARAGATVWLTWALLLALLIWLFVSLHLDFAYARAKLPFLLGLRLTPDGFIQGAVLTLFVTACSMLL